GGVAVHVTRSHVEHHSRRQLERARGLELKARQLEHVQVRYRLLEQIERGPAQVAAREDPPPGGGGHVGHETRYRTLAVGTGDADDRRPCRAREELDVAEYG